MSKTKKYLELPRLPVHVHPGVEENIKSALDSWLMGKLISASYPVDQKLDNLVNSL